MWPWKEHVRSRLRSAGWDVVRYQGTYRAQRTRILGMAGVDLVIDVGANVGQYGAELRATGYPNRILSVEPLAEAFSKLERRCSRDTRWRCLRTAVGEGPGHVTLRVSEGNIFTSVLKVTQSAVDASPNARQVKQERVPVTSLDLLLKDEPGTLAVKVDVQGYEGSVLDGATETLTRAEVVELELSPAPVYEGQMLMTEAIQRLADSGLILSAVDNLFRDPKSGRALQFNGIFVRPGSNTSLRDRR